MACSVHPYAVCLWACTGVDPARALISVSCCLFLPAEQLRGAVPVLQGACSAVRWAAPGPPPLLPAQDLAQAGMGSLLACGTAMRQSPGLVSPAQALAAKPCFENLIKVCLLHFFWACLPKRGLLCTPASLQSTRQDFSISKSNAIPIHVYNLACSPLV